MMMEWAKRSWGSELPSCFLREDKDASPFMSMYQY